MPTPNPTLRREYKGAAAATTLLNPMTNADLSFVLVAANNWPTGAVGKFIVTINRGQADEEKILCDTQTTRTVACLLANRGFDGTTAQAHAAGATVECTISAFDADEWNQHTNATSGVHGVAGPVADTSSVQTFTNKTLTAPAINSGVSDAASTIGGVSGASLAADRTAWTAYVPTLGNITLGNGTVSAAYKQVGKTCEVRFNLVLGSTTVVGTQPTFTLPSTSVAADQGLAGVGWDFSANAAANINGRVKSGTTTCELVASAGYVTATSPFTWAVSDSIGVSGTFETA